jgi:O-antigen ligase
MPTPTGPSRSSLHPTAFASLSLHDARARLALNHPTLDRAHRAAAAIFAFGLGLPITPMELAGVPLILVTLARLPAALHLYPSLLRRPAVIAALAWAAWAALAVTWSPDPAQGLDELAALRWLWVPLALWPVLDRPVLFVAALTAGMLAYNASQLTQLAGQSLGIEALTFGHAPDRIAGWSQPAVAGSILLAALGLHLPAALAGRGPSAWTARALALITALALLATGTRGAWLAAVPLTLAVTLLLAPRPPRPSRRAVLIAVPAALLIAAAAWAALGPAIASRIDEGRREIHAAISAGDFSTSTGGRIVMWAWAGRAIAERPITGVGTGGYRAWVTARQRERGIDPASQRVLDHAHSAYLHAAAAQGAVGLALLAAAAVFAVRHALTRPLDPHTAAAAALLALLAAGITDAVQVNAQTSALLATLGTIAISRPRPA